MKDVRVLLLKIADRDHNLDTLAGLKPHKQIRMTFETQVIYEPLHTIVNNDNNDITIASQKFTDYIEKFDLNDPSTLKHNLYNQTFHNFDHDTYLLAYNNTKAIIRQSEDKEWFEKLLSSSKFDDYADIVSMWTDGHEFLARFVFKK
jgi:hypothetical protein